MGSTPNPESFQFHFNALESRRVGLYISAANYADNPGEEEFEKISATAAEVADSFKEAMEILIDDTSYKPAERSRSVLTLLKNDICDRQDHLNKISGRKIFNDVKFPDPEEIEDSHFEEFDEDDKEDWKTEQFEQYRIKIEADLTKFCTFFGINEDNIVESSFKEDVYKRVKDVATLAGGVALGLLAADKLIRRN